MDILLSTNVSGTILQKLPIGKFYHFKRYDNGIVIGWEILDKICYYDVLTGNFLVSLPQTVVSKLEETHNFDRFNGNSAELAGLVRQDSSLNNA